MNWKLIISLSGFGILMGFASVLGLTKGIEWLLWLLIALFCGVWIARRVSTRLIFHGFLVGFLGGVIAPVIQALFFTTYLSNNPDFAERFAQVPAGLAPRVFILIIAPIIAAVFGIMLGLMTMLLEKLIRRRAVQLPMN